MTRALVFLACLLLGAPAFAQSGKVYRIGMLETTSASANKVNLDAFLRGLRDAGYVEGKNLIIDYRSAEGRSDRFAELADDLVRAKPDLIVVRGTPAALAAKKAAPIPVVMAAVANPVATGVVPNLARPGGNVTGLTSLVTEVSGKRMELIKQLYPGAKRIGFVLNPLNPNASSQFAELERAARSLGLQVQTFDARDAQTLDQALKTAVKQVDALLISAEAIVTAHRSVIIAFAAKHKMPAVYATRADVVAGGLISYGVKYPDLYYRAASYVDKILKGAKPGDLPIERATKLELVINQKTAKALGLTVPPSVLLRADEVIQ